ncbi:hypothetical protein A6V39_03745 [Candidatus Mycoplasma haematobovis]|uniref:Uncharacterized protein n=1 Tax=Candidatus Mycoplasma haematobovis TaxID=432608 RepID=A0A1A9QE81_9MOLU|nr:hypothetical protein [Candidatus Mycoplasma haematobovis]OAL10000.1 hypothetical protein A6V39_03745 [Candidatus Mycoplasma haematobovis]
MAIKPLAVKTSIGLLSAGGISAVVYQGYQAFNKEDVEKKKEVVKGLSVAKRLEAEKYVLLTKETKNDNHWAKILDSYKNISQDLKFEGFDGNDSSDGTIKGVDKLKDKCAETLISEDENLLKKAKKWCVTPISASELLNSKGFKILKTNNSNKDEEKSDWEQRINAFKEAKTANSELSKLITIEEGTDKLDSNIVAIKTKCKEFGAKLNYEDKFEENLENVEKWCAIKAPG